MRTKRNNKRALYESIMKDISKTVKKRLNENVNNNVFHIEILSNILWDILDSGTWSNKLWDNINTQWDNSIPENIKIKIYSIFLEIVLEQNNLNGLANIKVIQVNDEQTDFVSEYVTLEISGLEPEDFEYFYNILIKLDGRDDCYVGEWWFSQLQPGDNTDFVKWVFDNVEQLDEHNNTITFEDFMNNY